MPDISLTDTVSNLSSESEDGGSFFSFATLIKFILVIVILWFMWSSLSNNEDYHLGMGEFGDKIKTFFKSMEDKGRELVSRITNKPAPVQDAGKNDSNDSSDSDSDSDDEHKIPKMPKMPSSAHRPPVPPAMSNSSDKKPGFINEDTKYTFLDKADRSYSGPSPRADDSTSSTQKHQAGKSGYCYIGEDRGFRSCVKVETGDKCMSGQVFSRQDICVDPTLRE